MKVVINRAWGGFKLPAPVVQALDRHGPWDYEWEDRTNPVLIDYVMNNDTTLIAADVPDEATDWRIEDYDGMESVWYVVDGKMYQTWRE